MLSSGIVKLVKREYTICLGNCSDTLTIWFVNPRRKLLGGKEDQQRAVSREELKRSYEHHFIPMYLYDYLLKRNALLCN